MFLTRISVAEPGGLSLENSGLLWQVPPRCGVESSVPVAVGAAVVVLRFGMWGRRWWDLGCGVGGAEVWGEG